MNPILLLSVHRGERGHTMKLVIRSKWNCPKRGPESTGGYNVLRGFDAKSVRGFRGVDELWSRGRDVVSRRTIDCVNNIEKLNCIPTIAGSAMQIRHRSGRHYCGGTGNAWNSGGADNGLSSDNVRLDH